MYMNRSAYETFESVRGYMRVFTGGGPIDILTGHHILSRKTLSSGPPLPSGLSM